MNRNRTEQYAMAKQRWLETTDPTNNRLDAALLDQKVAGTFEDVDYAYVPVVAEGGWSIGIAVANEPGYNPVSGFLFHDHEAAMKFCDGMNKHIGLPMDHAAAIVCSTMGGVRYEGLFSIYGETR